MRATTVPILLVSLTGCAEASPTADGENELVGIVTPAQVGANIHDWDGQIVTVEGWLGRCEELNCMLYSDPADRRILEQGGEWSTAQEHALRRTLSVGADDTFDASALPLQNSRVRIRGRVNDMCWPANCSDRAPDIEPLSIQPAETN